MSSITHTASLLWSGWDVHKNSITAAWLEPGSDEGVIDRIAHDEASVRRLIGRMGRPERIRICYEAGPTGYGLARLLVSMGVTCQVIAPSLIPTRSGDRVQDRPA